MKPEPLFSDEFLDSYLFDFKTSSITGIREIMQVIRSLNELEIGKLASLKEEEIKSRFINLFFGDVLGFNYGNSNSWQLREEKKSKTDGTKSDGALGYFYPNKVEDEVHAVIELKDAITGLDLKQNRSGSQTPVEQAFGYSHKMGGSCKWVIVSNIKETRFYASGDSSRYQAFFLKDLMGERKLKELLFLFHKDRFIKKKGKSKTDILLERSKTLKSELIRPIHIIDEIDRCLNGFTGFGFVDPNFLAAIYPFNILEEHVWHYHDGTLFTINERIYRLMQGVNVVGEAVHITEEMEKEIRAENVFEAKAKLVRAFRILNSCLITKITAIRNYKNMESRNKDAIGFSIRNSFPFSENEGISKNIEILNRKACNCLSCIYRTLDFRKFLEKLKVGIGNDDLTNAEYAYGHYLAATDNFKTSYGFYRAIGQKTKGKEGKEVQYFLAKQNSRLLHNLLLFYPHSDGKQILSDIRSVDLDKVIYDEIEFNVEKEVRNYLVDVKEDALIYKLQDEIEEILMEVSRLKESFDKGSFKWLGPDYARELYIKYYFLYLHINANYIIYDSFSRYKSLTKKIFHGLVLSYLTKEIGPSKFDEFILTEAILHIGPKHLQETLRLVDRLEADEGVVKGLLWKLDNFTSSYCADFSFGKPIKSDIINEFLNSYKFRQTLTDIFSNLFTILTRLEISKSHFSRSKKFLFDYLQVENELAWFELSEFVNFLNRKGDLLDAEELLEILKISIDRDEFGSNKYTNLIETTASAMGAFYPEFRISQFNLIRIAVVKSSSETGSHANYKHLIPLLKICDENCKQFLIDTFKHKLDNEFRIDFYEALIDGGDFDWRAGNYFQIYSDQVNKTKGGRAYKFGKLELTDLVFINFIYRVYKLNVDFDRVELRTFSNLNYFETWLLSPFRFDYSKFDAKWLMDLNDPVYLQRIQNIPDICVALDLELRRSFDPILASIRFIYWS